MREGTVYRITAFACVVALIAFAGCGGSSSSTSKGGNAPAAPAAKATGNVTWCIGKDTTGAFSDMVSRYNKANPNAHAKLLELPTSADQQRTQIIQRLRAKSPECDVIGMDVTWTAEFAGQNWLRDVSDLVNKRQADFIPSTVKTAQYNSKTWAVPFNTNAGFLYYRTDKVKSPPSTWQQVYSDAQKDGGIVYQGSQYEGLTVDYLEMLYSAGGKIVDSSGTKLDLDKNKAAQVLTFMANGLKNGAAPKANVTYMEEESRRAFESGKPAFMRNWPYAYALDKKSPIGSKFAVAPLPGWQGGQAASVLGGYNLGISAYSKNPAGASAFIDFVTKPAQQLDMGVKAALPPVLTSVYDDPQLKKAMPFATELRKAVQQGQARPVSPVYPQITEAIYKNVYAALQGQTSPQAAVNKMSTQVQSALKTF
jgi:multiple sugar transport system substrate-binding protein